MIPVQVPELVQVGNYLGHRLTELKMKEVIEGVGGGSLETVYIRTENGDIFEFGPGRLHTENVTQLFLGSRDYLLVSGYLNRAKYLRCRLTGDRWNEDQLHNLTLCVGQLLSGQKESGPIVEIVAITATTYDEGHLCETCGGEKSDIRNDFLALIAVQA